MVRVLGMSLAEWARSALACSLTGGTSATIGPKVPSVAPLAGPLGARDGTVAGRSWRPGRWPGRGALVAAWSRFWSTQPMNRPFRRGDLGFCTNKSGFVGSSDQQRPLNQRMCTPEIARDTINRWISEVPSKIV
jgi:hypothetical protein